MSIRYTFALPGIRCTNCVGAITNALQPEPHLLDFSVDLVEKKLSVLVNDTQSEDEVWSTLVDRLDAIGQPCEKIPPYSIHLEFVKQKARSWQALLNSHQTKGVVGILGGAAMMALMLVMPMASLPLMIVLTMSSLSLTFFLGYDSFRAAFKTWQHRQVLTMDTLFAMSTGTLFMTAIAAFWWPWMPKMLDAGLFIFGFRHLGLAIEGSLMQKMALGVRFQDRVNPKVKRIHSDLWVDPALLKAGDCIELFNQEVLPVDGICSNDDGVWAFDTIITGSTLPKHFKKGERLLAGFRLAPGAHLQLEVTDALRQSYLHKLDAALEQAEAQKAPIERATSTVLQYFIPLVIAIALLASGVAGFFFNGTVAIQTLVAVLMSACPCTLGFITPLVVKIGIRKGFEHGVHFKSAQALEQAAQIDTVVFDLNGTLTTGVPEVRAFMQSDTTLDLRELLGIARTMEQNAQHPFGRAIHDYAAQRSLSSSEPKLVAVNARWFGVSATHLGQTWHIGNRDMMQAEGISLDGQPSYEAQEGEALIYLAREKTIVGFFILHDPLHHEALPTIGALMAMGKTVHICTGADEVTALRYAHRLGLSAHNTHAGCVGSSMLTSPKVALIHSLQQQGHRVAMVGDAANDSHAVAASDFGLAMQSQSVDEMTQAHSGALLSHGALWPVCNALWVAKETVGHIKRSLWVSLGYNLLSLIAAPALMLSAGFMLNPAVGVILMSLQTIGVLLYASRFKNKTVAAGEPPIERSNPAILTLLDATITARPNDKITPAPQTAFATLAPRPEGEAALFPDMAAATLKADPPFGDSEKRAAPFLSF